MHAECQSHVASLLNNVIKTICESHQEMDTEVNCNRLTVKLWGGVWGEREGQSRGQGTESK